MAATAIGGGGIGCSLAEIFSVRIITERPRTLSVYGTASFIRAEPPVFQDRDCCFLFNRSRDDRLTLETRDDGGGRYIASLPLAGPSVQIDTGDGFSVELDLFHADGDDPSADEQIANDCIGWRGYTLPTETLVRRRIGEGEAYAEVLLAEFEYAVHAHIQVVSLPPSVSSTVHGKITARTTSVADEEAESVLFSRGPQSAAEGDEDGKMRLSRAMVAVSIMEGDGTSLIIHAELYDEQNVEIVKGAVVFPVQSAGEDAKILRGNSGDLFTIKVLWKGYY